MASRRERGLCFNCDEQFTPGHRCRPPQFHCLLAELDDEPVLLPSPEPDPSALDPHLHCLLAEQNIHPSQQASPLSPTPTTPTDSNNETSPSISFHAFTGQLVPSTLKIAGRLAGRDVVVLIDGGSTNNFIQSKLAKHLGLTVQPSSYLRVTVGNGDTLDCGGQCEAIPVTLGPVTVNVDLILLPIYGADLVLGVQWLSGLGPVLIDFDQLWMQFTLNGSQIRLQGITQPSLKPVSSSSALYHRTQPTDGAQFYHLAINLIESESTQTPNINPDAPLSFITPLTHLLRQYDRTFSIPKGLPPPRAYDHHINLLPTTAPINVRPYRYPHFQKAEIERLVGEMLADGTIRPSTSPFSSPVILVKKRDGTWRFCVDYRGLNAVTVKDRFPIPTVDELFDELHDAQVFSKLDLRAGYHQIRIHPPDVEKSAFRTHQGHYEFLVMPFGLSNAPSTFQALMNSVFRQALRKFVLVFFDDILIYSSSWESHLDHLKVVFALLH